MKIYYKKKVLQFSFTVGTSRGILKDRAIWIFKLKDEETDKTLGKGEAAPLQNLSLDDREDFETYIEAKIKDFKEIDLPASEEEIFDLVNREISNEFPSVKFAFETMLLDAFHKGKGKILDNLFSDKNQPITINGLVWMGEEAFMRQQIDEKLEKGFSCVKMKIGAIDWPTEHKLLQYIRSHYSEKELTLRVDANGAFNKKNVFGVLDQLAQLDIHSIEQPVKAKKYDLMAKVCSKSPVPIALDEDLIGIFDEDKEYLLSRLNPHYVIFKPTLLGGIAETLEWIEICDRYQIGWWVTSALESNIGLNAIAQFTSKYADLSMPQGLGTGQVFVENTQPEMRLVGDQLYSK